MSKKFSTVLRENQVQVFRGNLMIAVVYTKANSHTLTLNFLQDWLSLGAKGPSVSKAFADKESAIEAAIEHYKAFRSEVRDIFNIALAVGVKTKAFDGKKQFHRATKAVKKWRKGEKAKAKDFNVKAPYPAAA